MKHIIAALCVVCGVFAGCKTDITGGATPNRTPETYTTVDTIIRNGNNRLSTQIGINWWATDPDGYVTGYEYSFENPITAATIWRFTSKTDSVFLINLPLGADTADIRFSVRAIDNLGEKDPTPAQLVLPLKNTAPTIAFKYIKAGGNPLAGGNVLVGFPILRYNWLATDADGAANLRGYELTLNDTARTPIFLGNVYSGATLVADNPSATSSDCSILAGNSNQAQPNKLQGLNLNDTNVLYIRAIDLSGAKSAYIAAKKVFVKRLTSNIVLVNAYANGILAIDQFYNTQLNGIGITNVEKIQILQKNAQFEFTQLAPDYATQNRIFGLFKHIIWVSDDMNFSMVYAQGVLNTFFNNGGNLLMSCRPGGEDLSKSPFYEFTPIDSLQQPPAGKLFLLADTSTIAPLASGYPMLQNEGFLTVPRPIKLLAGCTPLLRANIILRDGASFTPYTGNSVVMGIKTNGITGSKIVFSSLQLHKINANNAIGTLLTKVLRGEFGIM